MKRRRITYLLNCIILGSIIGLAIVKECYIIAILAIIVLGLHVYSYYKDVKESEQNK